MCNVVSTPQWPCNVRTVAGRTVDHAGVVKDCETAHAGVTLVDVVLAASARWEAPASVVEVAVELSVHEWVELAVPRVGGTASSVVSYVSRSRRSRHPTCS